MGVMSEIMAHTITAPARCAGPRHRFVLHRRSPSDSLALRLAPNLAGNPEPV
jgi:hypothetical protein